MQLSRALDASRFAWDVPGFLARGRALAAASGAPAWAAPVGGELVAVVADPEVLRLPELGYYRGEVLAPLLGSTSAIALDGEAHALPRALVDDLVDDSAVVDAPGHAHAEERLAPGARGPELVDLHALVVLIRAPPGVRPQLSHGPAPSPAPARRPPLRRRDAGGPPSAACPRGTA